MSARHGKAPEEDVQTGTLTEGARLRNEAIAQYFSVYSIEELYAPS